MKKEIIVFPTLEEIKAKEEQVLKAVNEYEIKAIKGRPSPAKDFLMAVKSVVSLAVKNKIPNPQILQILEKEYGVKISSNILKVFIKNTLGLDNSVVVNKKNNEIKEDTTSKKSDNNNSRITANIDDI